MQLPPGYAHFLDDLGFTEISFGYGELKLFTPGELDEAQIGYSRSTDGKWFCDGKPGSWNPAWIAIGYDTLLGDPVILDTASANLPVMTAMHGEGPWEPVTIAGSLDGFSAALRIVKKLSVGRESPVAVEQNPLSSDERDTALKQIRSAIGDDVAIEFWEVLLRDA